MSIRKMKALSLLAPKSDVKKLLRALQHLGCVELSEIEGEGFTSVDLGSHSYRPFAKETEQALAALDHYAPAKSGFLTPKREMEEKLFWDKTRWRDGINHARNINAIAQTIEAMSAKEAQLVTQSMSLTPWLSYSLPLEKTGTEQVRLILGTLPIKQDLSAVADTLTAAAPMSELYPISADKDAHYVAVLVHRSEEAAALEALHSCTFTSPVWKDLVGTAAENKQAFDREVEQIRTLREEKKQELTALAAHREELQLLIDVMNQYLGREEAADKLRERGSVVALKGWLPEEREEDFKALMDISDCAWELREPTEEEYENVPVSLKSNRVTDALNMVTEMYSLPAYGTLDPNPLMAPFFILFYGIMMADMGYGLLMFLAGLICLKKKKPEGTMKHMSGLLVYCGISTFIWGAITGGFFGDFLTQFIALVKPGTVFELPSLFTPLGDTMMILIGAMCLGAVQIITGMIISVIEKCKRKKYMDALWNEVTWWIVFIGIALAVLGKGKAVLIVGGVMVLVGSGWDAKGFGKVTAVFSSLYNNITGYAGDILSYSRLMALMLAGSVIAQVFNTIGAIFGNVFLFVLISLIGNTLNFALNLLGCYVHDLRLQCLEYFGKFYVDGGRAFSPLSVKTKYVNVTTK